MFQRCVTPTSTPTPTPTPTPTQDSYNCLIKLTPLDRQNDPKAGNNGLGFPLKIICNLIRDEFCYLAFELGNDPGSDSPITKQDLGLIAAPCLDDTVDDFCYLAIEEDGITNFEREENLDYFSVQCINIF